jgi:hypothetical protein
MEAKCATPRTKDDGHELQRLAANLGLSARSVTTLCNTKPDEVNTSECRDNEMRYLLRATYSRAHALLAEHMDALFVMHARCLCGATRACIRDMYMLLYGARNAVRDENRAIKDEQFVKSVDEATGTGASVAVQMAVAAAALHGLGDSILEMCRSESREHSPLLR